MAETLSNYVSESFDLEDPAQDSLRPSGNFLPWAWGPSSKIENSPAKLASGVPSAL